MQYLLLIYDQETTWDSFPEAKRAELTAAYRTFTEQIRASGHLIGGNALQRTHTATTVRVRDAKPTMTDGPFAETREALGGYYLIEAKDLDEATKIAARIPSAQFGSIEVRPLNMHLAM